MEETPKVGEQAPGFELPDSTGQKNSLAGFLSVDNVMLVFFRGLW